MEETRTDARLRAQQELALAKLGDLAYHLDTPHRSGRLPPRVTPRLMQSLAEMRVLELDEYTNPLLGYTLTSTGLRMYCLLTGATPRRYRVYVRWYGSEIMEEEGEFDMRKAYDRVAEILETKFTNGILHAWYVPA